MFFLKRLDILGHCLVLSIFKKVISYSLILEQKKGYFNTFQPVDKAFSFSQPYLTLFTSFKAKDIGNKILRYSNT